LLQDLWKAFPGNGARARCHGQVLSRRRNHLEVSTVEKGFIPGTLQEAPDIYAGIAVDFCELYDASANDAGGIFDHHGLTGLVGNDQTVHVDPRVGPVIRFTVQQAADRDDGDLRHLCLWH